MASAAWTNRYALFLDSDNEDVDSIENINRKREQNAVKMKNKSKKEKDLQENETPAVLEEKKKILSQKDNNVEDLITEEVEDRKDADEPSANQGNESIGRGSRGARGGRGGNLGGSQSETRLCYNCKQSGHISRDCQVQYDENCNLQCYKCNDMGHIARSCPNIADNPSSDARVCYTCKQPGHLSKDCKAGDDETSKSLCFKCNEMGHIARSCPNVADNPSDARLCYNCKQPGHVSRDCKAENDDKSELLCFKCNQMGHIARSCPDVVDNPSPVPSENEDSSTLTLDEWKSQQTKKTETQFNIRKAGEGSEMDPKWKKTYAYKKEKEENEDDDEENEIYLQRVHRQKKVVDIKFNFADLNRSGAGSRGRGVRGGRGGRGRGVTKGDRAGNGKAVNVLDEHSFPELG